jgi:hypothetical protein
MVNVIKTLNILKTLFLKSQKIHSKKNFFSFFLFSLFQKEKAKRKKKK